MIDDFGVLLVNFKIIIYNCRMQIGDILLNRYQLLHRLGHGAHGAVFRAYDTRKQESVAIKWIAELVAQGEFRAAANQLAQLSHPQLPRLRDYFFDEVRGCFLVYDFVEGVDLQTVVEQFHPLSAAQLGRWLKSACEPVAYLHQQGQLHLDIKPSNIRLTPDGKIFLVDTGFSSLGVAAGSVGYAAPEQQRQQNVTPLTDIFALGGTLYTLLTNVVPTEALLRDTKMMLLKSAREINPACDTTLSIVASRALSLAPTTRYETVGDFAKALNPSDPAIEKPIARATATVGPPRRRPLHPQQRRAMEMKTIYALSALLAVLLLVGGLIGRIALFPAEEGPTPTVAIVLKETSQSQIALSLTEIAESGITPTPPPTPMPTPEPITDEKTGATLLYILGGQFSQGNNEAEDDDQKPAHRVQLRPFYLDQTEVTNKQYALCVADEMCTPPQRNTATYHPAYYGDPDYDNYPVIFVSWDQADAFCQWRGGRLPSESEWEFAAGFRPTVGKKTKFAWGDFTNEPNGNFCDKNCTLETRDAKMDDGHRDTAPVDSYPKGRSAFGVADMSGNVLEWVSDWYDRKFYATSVVEGPLGPPTGEAKVVRGGSFLSEIDNLSITVRGAYVPQVARANLGFRCALTPP